MTGKPRSLRIGTRSSALARYQTGLVALRLRELSALDSDLVVITSDGDLDVSTPLPEIGGKGVFTEALERALKDGTIDLAVHSLKDVPVEPTPGLCLAATCMREDPRDVLIAAKPWTLATLPPGSVVGTCSTRRSAQLLAQRPDLSIASLRGNVDTRVNKALRGDYDAIVIAAAGVIRLGLGEAIREYLPLDKVTPAPGQGALSIQCRESDEAIVRLVAALDEPATRAATTAERAFLEGLGGGCAAPIAAHARIVEDGALCLQGMVAAHARAPIVRVSTTGPVSSARELGLSLARQAAAAAVELPA